MKGNVSADLWRAFRVSFDPQGDSKTRGLMTILFILSFTVSALSVIQPLVFGKLIDSIVDRDNESLLLIIICYAAIFFFARALKHLWLPLFTAYTLRVQRRISQHAFNHMLSLPSSFYLKRKRHSLPQIISNATIGVHNILSVILDNIAPVIFELTMAAMVIAYLFGLKVMAFLVVGMLAFILVTVFGSEVIRPYQREYTEHNNRSYEILSEGLSSEDTVKLFRMSDILVDRHSENLTYFERACMKFFIGSALLQTLQVLCVVASFVPVLFIGVSLVNIGQITIGEFVVLNMFTMQFISPLQQVAYAYRQVKEGAIELEILEEIISEPTEISLNRGNQRLDPSNSRKLDFKSVSYKSAEGGFEMHDIDIQVESGKTVAIVGTSGSGKSTLIKLLTRRMPLGSGEILLDNLNVENIEIEFLRKEVAVVSQDIVLFDETLKFNILLGRSIPEEELKKILKQVELDKYVDSQVNGLETTVGDRGLRLSGGERQRVGIARALVGSPSVLIFDEATSALDYETELQVSKNIELAAIGTTTLIVAHRLSTIRRADLIYVLDHGRIIESGTHDELIMLEGMYARLYMSQDQQDIPELTKNGGYEPMKGSVH